MRMRRRILTSVGRMKSLIWGVCVSFLMHPVYAFAEGEDKAVGTWAIRLKTVTSSCDDVKEGSTKAEQWVINSTGQGLTVEVAGNQQKKMIYTAGLVGNKLSGSYVQAGFLGGVKGVARFGLSISESGETAEGQRVVSRKQPCAIVYDLSAKKIF